MPSYYAQPKTKQSRKLIVTLVVTFLICLFVIATIAIQKTAPPAASTLSSNNITVDGDIFSYTMLFQESSDRMGTLWIVILSVVGLAGLVSFFLLRKNFALFFLIFALTGILLVVTNRLSEIPLKQEIVTGEQLYNATGYTLPADNPYPEYSEIEELANNGESAIITFADATTYQLLDYEITAEFSDPENIQVTHTKIGPTQNKELLESYFLNGTPSAEEEATENNVEPEEAPAPVEEKTNSEVNNKADSEVTTKDPEKNIKDDDSDADSKISSDGKIPGTV